VARVKRGQPWTGLAVLSVLCSVSCATHHGRGVSAPAAGGTLNLVTVTPSSGERVSKTTVVVAELAYSVTGFRKGRFYVTAQVATDDPKRTTSGRMPPARHVKLKATEGRLSLAFPVESVWDMPGIRRPLRIWFYLHETTGHGRSRVIAMTGPTDYGVD